MQPVGETFGSLLVEKRRYLSRVGGHRAAREPARTPEPLRDHLRERDTGERADDRRGVALAEEWFTPFLAGFIGLSLAEAAYMAEILRSSLLAVDPEQRLAAKTLGMTPPQTMRKIVLPQVIRIAIPPTGSELITMLKFTSLTSVISLQELLTVAQQNISATFKYAEFYAAAAVYYLAIVSILMAAQVQLERRYEWTTRRRRSGLPRLRTQGA